MEIHEGSFTPWDFGAKGVSRQTKVKMHMMEATLMTAWIDNFVKDKELLKFGIGDFRITFSSAKGVDKVLADIPIRYGCHT